MSGLNLPILRIAAEGWVFLLALALLASAATMGEHWLLLVLGVAVPAWARAAGRGAAVETARADAAFGADVLDLVRGLADQA